jgi:hypothetical protein
MARILSEDEEQISHIDLVPGAKETLHGQGWQRFSLKIRLGHIDLSIPPDANPAEVDCLLCREPQDELALLATNLDQFLNSTKDVVLFEPSEPSFELSIKRAQAGGARVEVWLDSGNATQGIYRWDAVGARFQTTERHLVTFLAELRQEFAC